MMPEWNSFINADCMEYLRQMPDKCVDLAITDPPYGGGFTEGGGCQGWFAKYRQDIDRQTDRSPLLTPKKNIGIGLAGDLTSTKVFLNAPLK